MSIYGILLLLAALTMAVNHCGKFYKELAESSSTTITGEQLLLTPVKDTQVNPRRELKRLLNDEVEETVEIDGTYLASCKVQET